MNTSAADYDWLVVGAGPAGIAAIGKLLDVGIAPKQIAWIDPAFQVGDFGTRWTNVPSNTRVGLFQKFFHACKAFKFEKVAPDFDIYQLPDDDTCQLIFAAKPLQWISDHLKETVHAIKGEVTHLSFNERHWEIQTNAAPFTAKNVILALGSDPKALRHPNVETIPLEHVMDTEQLKTRCANTDTVAVFGSSHSAILAMRRLIEHPVKKVVNFFLEPLKYAVYYDDWILFDDTGLKGTTAAWAHEHIDDKHPENLARFLSTAENLKKELPQCDKVVYAIGFTPRTLSIEGVSTLKYNDTCGIIAPGLFGVGIAFPERNVDRYGNIEHRVGLWKFMDYLNRVIPLWTNYSS